MSRLLRDTWEIMTWMVTHPQEARHDWLMSLWIGTLILFTVLAVAVASGPAFR